MPYTTLLTEKKDQIGTITFNRPDILNALSQLGFREFIQALKEMDADDGIRVVVITGAGHAFSAGLDIDEARQGPPETGLAGGAVTGHSGVDPAHHEEHEKAHYRFDQWGCGRRWLYHCAGL